MKTKRRLSKDLAKVLCNFLILFAPLALSNTASFYFWGEPECPEALKESIYN